MSMMIALLAAGQRLADALTAENEALAALDLARAAGLADAKIRASDSFAAAFATMNRAGVRTEGAVREATERLAATLQTLGAENRRLLERAISVQAQVIETIAGAATQRPFGTGYQASGHRPAMRPSMPMALATRA